jgi:hypothetical protein
MKPSPRPEARRRLLLAGGAAALGVAALGLAPSARAAPGFGPLRLGMPQEAALRALGPAALPAALCEGVQGVLFDWPDTGLSASPVPAMAMFGGRPGAPATVSEIQANLSRPEGGLDRAAWQALVEAQLGMLRDRLGLPPEPGVVEEDAMGTARIWRFRPDGAEVALAARWMRRSGAGFTRLHWLAAGAKGVIEG